MSHYGCLCPQRDLWEDSLSNIYCRAGPTPKLAFLGTSATLLGNPIEHSAVCLSVDSNPHIHPLPVVTTARKEVAFQQFVFDKKTVSQQSPVRSSSMAHIAISQRAALNTR